MAPRHPAPSAAPLGSRTAIRRPPLTVTHSLTAAVMGTPARSLFVTHTSLGIQASPFGAEGRPSRHAVFWPDQGLAQTGRELFACGLQVVVLAARTVASKANTAVWTLPRTGRSRQSPSDRRAERWAAFRIKPQFDLGRRSIDVLTPGTRARRGAPRHAPSGHDQLWTDDEVFHSGIVTLATIVCCARRMKSFNPSRWQRHTPRAPS